MDYELRLITIRSNSLFRSDNRLPNVLHLSLIPHSLCRDTRVVSTLVCQLSHKNTRRAKDVNVIPWETSSRTTCLAALISAVPYIQEWNSLPSHVSPSSYKINSFKRSRPTEVNKHHVGCNYGVVSLLVYHLAEMSHCTEKNIILQFF